MKGFVMGKVAVITDSNSGITQNQAGEYGIYVLPMPFYIDEKLYFNVSTVIKIDDSILCSSSMLFISAAPMPCSAIFLASSTDCFWVTEILWLFTTWTLPSKSSASM